MYKWIMFVLFIGAGVLGIGVMLNQVDTHANELKAAEAEANDTSVLKLKASNFKFDQAEYKVKAGSKMTVKLQLLEGVHGVAIPDLNVNLSSASPSAEVKFDKPGRYELHCNFQCGLGHDDMKAAIVVE